MLLLGGDVHIVYAQADYGNKRSTVETVNSPMISYAGYTVNSRYNDTVGMLRKVSIYPDFSSKYPV